MNPGISRLDGSIMTIHLPAVVGLGVVAGFLLRKDESGGSNGL